MKITEHQKYINDAGDKVVIHFLNGDEVFYAAKKSNREEFYYGRGPFPLYRMELNAFKESLQYHGMRLEK